MSKIHIHEQKSGMTWAGTPDEDRERVRRDTESCHRADRGRVGRGRLNAAVIAFITVTASS
jgi:hypothetical protein